MNENNIKVLFSEGIETITISKNDYDRLYGQLTYENIVLQSKIDKLNNENFELAKRIHNTKKIVNKVKKVSDYMNGIACDDLLSALEGK